MLVDCYLAGGKPLGCGALSLAQLTARKLRRLRQQQVKAPDPVDLQMQPLRR